MIIDHNITVIEETGYNTLPVKEMIIIVFIKHVKPRMCTLQVVLILLFFVYQIHTILFMCKMPEQLINLIDTEKQL